MTVIRNNEGTEEGIVTFELIDSGNYNDDKTNDVVNNYNNKHYDIIFKDETGSLCIPCETILNYKTSIQHCNNLNINVILNDTIHFVSNVFYNNIYSLGFTCSNYLYNKLLKSTNTKGMHLLINIVGSENVVINYIHNDIVIFSIMYKNNEYYFITHKVYNINDKYMCNKLLLVGNFNTIFNNDYYLSNIIILNNLLHKLDINFPCKRLSLRCNKNLEVVTSCIDLKDTSLVIHGCDRLNYIEYAGTIDKLYVSHLYYNELVVNVETINNLTLAYIECLNLRCAQIQTVHLNCEIEKLFISQTKNLKLVHKRNIYNKLKLIHFKYVDENNNRSEIIKSLPIVGIVDAEVIVKIGYSDEIKMYLKNITDNTMRLLRYKYPNINDDILTIINSYV